MALVSHKPADNVLAPKIITRIDNSYQPWWTLIEINQAFLGKLLQDIVLAMCFL